MTRDNTLVYEKGNLWPYSNFAGRNFVKNLEEAKIYADLNGKFLHYSSMENGYFDMIYSNGVEQEFYETLDPSSLKRKVDVFRGF